MITEKEKIEQFKRELRSYNFHQRKVDEINDQLTALSVKINGVSSPRFKEVVLENTVDPYSSNKIDLIMKEEKLIKERTKHWNEIKTIENALDLLNKDQRRVVIEIYIKNKSFDEIASKEYVSKRKLRYDIDSIIKSILNEIETKI